MSGLAICSKRAGPAGSQPFCSPVLPNGSGDVGAHRGTAARHHATCQSAKDPSLGGKARLRRCREGFFRGLAEHRSLTIAPNRGQWPASGVARTKTCFFVFLHVLRIGPSASPSSPSISATLGPHDADRSGADQPLPRSGFSSAGDDAGKPGPSKRSDRVTKRNAPTTQITVLRAKRLRLHGAESTPRQECQPQSSRSR